jgi:glucoamylase
MTARVRHPTDWEPAPSVDAPGAPPGISPTWTSSAKDAVGSSLGPARLWFTLGFGILNEVYWPRIDLPQVRDLGFIIADGSGFGPKSSVLAITAGPVWAVQPHRSACQ